MIEFYETINKEWAFFVHKGTVSTNRGNILFCENFHVERPNVQTEIKLAIKEGRGRNVAPFVGI